MRPQPKNELFKGTVTPPWGGGKSASYRRSSIQTRTAAWGAEFWYIVRVLPGPTKQRACKPSLILSWIRRKNNPPGRLVRSSYSFQNFVLRGAHLARLIFEKKYWEGLDRIFRKNCWRVDLKRAPRPFYFWSLDLMGNRWPNVMAIWKL
jgi:hypothetical protein